MLPPEHADPILHAAGERARIEMRTMDAAMAVIRLASFRTYLSAVVRSMSPMVPEALGAAGVDLDSAIRRLAPSPAWPAIAGRRTPAQDAMYRQAAVPFGKVGRPPRRAL